MKRVFLFVIALLLAWQLSAQELLVPAGGSVAPPAKRAAKDADILTLVLPFFDDFSGYEGAPDLSLWSNDDALVNKDFGPLPPTVGVATLDALDAHGRLHAGAGTASFGGDTLASHYIRLDSLFSPQAVRLTPADSVYLTFYYLPGGGYGDRWNLIGDAPERGDSLILEFYNATANRWQTVWSRAGESVDTLLAHTGKTWQWAAVAVREADYFSARFRFRFLTLCSMDPIGKVGIAANCDQWNLHYIRLATGRNRRDSLIRDVAFVEKAPTMLKQFIAMPARHYTAADMAANIEMVITNRYSQQLATSYAYTVYDGQGGQVAHYDGGSENAPPYAQGHRYQTMGAHAQPPIDFSYTMRGTGRQQFSVVHVVKEGYAGDAFPHNDTVRFEQVFDNYFAYDDGTPENGYGITSPGSLLQMAVRFPLAVRDTLTAVDLYFNSTRDNGNVGMGFHLCVWSNEGGSPGTLLYRNAEVSKVSEDALGHYVRYALSEPVILSADTYFIGFEQTSRNYINIGFDRSRQIVGQNFYRVSNQWQQSFLNGAILLRPCFGARALVDIVVPEEQVLSFSVYPNPASEQIFITLPETLHGVASSLATCCEALRITLYDQQGRCVLDCPFQESLDVSTLPVGLYLLRISHRATGRYAAQKIMIR